MYFSTYKKTLIDLMSDERFFRSLTSLELSQIKSHSYFVGLEKTDLLSALIEAKISAGSKSNSGANSQLVKRIFGVSFSRRNLSRGLQGLNPSGLGIMKSEMEILRRYIREDMDGVEASRDETKKGAVRHLLLSHKYKNL